MMIAWRHKLQFASRTRPWPRWTTPFVQAASRAARRRCEKEFQRLLHEEREREIAEDYRRAYTERPEEEAVGEAGLTLMAESIAELERGSRNHR